MKIVIDNKIPFIRGVFEPYAEVVYLPGKETTSDVVKDADAIVTRTRTLCNEALLKGSAVKAIATATIGYDHIDTAWVESAGIKWANAPGCNSWSVKQYIASALVSLARAHGFDLQGMTLGVVGVGNVGSKVAEVGRILGCRVLLCDPPRARREGSDGFVDIDTITSEADIITLHVPLSRDGEDATFHMFDASRLSALRPSQILINSSRGPVVDNSALKELLKAGGLKAAVLDVWEGEPDLDPELVSLLDYSTPHIAGYSADGKANGTTASVRFIARELGIAELLDWKVTGIPAPTFGKSDGRLEFLLDASGRTFQDVVSEAILHTYDIAVDTAELRSHLGDFEKLRGDYPIRREPTSYSIYLRGSSGRVADALKELGFSIVLVDR